MDNGVVAQCLKPLYPARLATGFFLYPEIKKQRHPQGERHKWIEMTEEKGKRGKVEHRVRRGVRNIWTGKETEADTEILKD